MTRFAAAIAATVVSVLTACTAGESAAPRRPSTPGVPATAGTTQTPSSPAPASTPAPSSAGPQPADFDAAAAKATVRQLAALGPREASSAAFRRAERLVSARFAELGYAVSHQRFRVPAGESWGVPVGAGRTANVVARLPGTPADAPYVVVGAHLDTVPQAPGAEDNASGVAVLLQLAELASGGATRRPVTFVAFGAEEPRGPGDDEHHFGSQTYVRRVVEGQGARVTAMVSLDRVGTQGTVPVCTGGLSPLRVRRALLAAAERVGVRARPCENRTSDHWPFEKAGEAVARLGGLAYAGYHSPGDVPRVVSERQLGRVGQVLWEWLRVR